MCVLLEQHDSSDGANKNYLQIHMLAYTLSDILGNGSVYEMLSIYMATYRRCSELKCE